MPSVDQPPTWRERTLSRWVRRESRLADGTAISLWAFPEGIRPPTERHISFAPAVLLIASDAAKYLRYRISYRGAWVVEVRISPSDLPADERVVRSRGEALAMVTAALDRRVAVTKDHIGQLLAA